jgi:hypothetical protein
MQEGGKMATVQNIGHVEPLPRYISPDASMPDYDEILEQLQDYQRSQIGSSYYYIRAENDRMILCRILPGGGKIFFHEIVDHEKHGISDDDLETAVRLETGLLSKTGYHQISPHIEAKLRVVLEFPK